MLSGTCSYSLEGLSSQQVVEFCAIWSGMEDSIDDSKQFLSNKFSSGLVGPKSVWQNVLTCQLTLQFHYIILCITMVRIHSPLDLPFNEVWLLKTEQWWDQISVLVNYLKLLAFVFLNGRTGCFIMAMGIVLRYRQTAWIKYHVPHSAASGDHCCKLLKMVSEKKKTSANFFLLRPGIAQCIGTCKETGFTWTFLRSSVPSKLTAFLKSWLGLVCQCTVPTCNILFVVMEALLQVQEHQCQEQCQEHHLHTLHPASSITRKTGRVALPVTIALQGAGGWTGRDRSRMVGDFDLDKVLCFQKCRFCSYVSSL